jgi:hypothetical protein
VANVIKIRLKKTVSVGFAAITTRTFEAGTEGFIVDAAPVVRDGNLTAEFLVLLPAYEHVTLLTANELELLDAPADREDAKIGLVHMLADMVHLSFEMHDSGVDLSFLSSMRRKQADKANDPPTP